MDGDGIILNALDTKTVRHNGHWLAMCLYAVDNLRSASSDYGNTDCPHIADGDTSEAPTGQRQAR